MPRNERGSVALVLLATIALPAVFGLAGVALDFGRQSIQRSRLQTAADAGSLAGSMESDKYVNLIVMADCSVCDRRDMFGNCIASHTESRTRQHTGVLARDALAVASSGWPDNCSYRRHDVVSAWAELRAGAEAVAEETFRHNAPWADQVAVRRIGRDTVEVSANDSWDTGFLRFFGIRRLGASVLSQATARVKAP